MVRFKTIKYKHYRKALKLIAEDVTEEEQISFVISLVAEWDFVDADTGEALPVNLASLDELSLDQFNEAMELFNREMNFVATVPKANAEPSHSILMPSNLSESPETSPSGYQPLYSPGDSG